MIKLFDNNIPKVITYFSENEFASIATDDGEIYIWNIVELVQKKKFHKHSSTIMALSYGPDGSCLASCGLDRSFQITDINTGMSVFSKEFAYPLTALKWDGSLIFLGDQEGNLFLWDVVEVREVLQMSAHEGEC